MKSKNPFNWLGAVVFTIDGHIFLDNTPTDEYLPPTHPILRNIWDTIYHYTGWKFEYPHCFICNAGITGSLSLTDLQKEWNEEFVGPFKTTEELFAELEKKD